MITPEILAIVMFLTTLGLLLFGFPVAFTLAGTALLFGFLGDALEIFNFRMLGFFPQRIFGTMINEPLVAVPLFIFMGIMLEKTKIAAGLLQSIGELFGTTKGGLGIGVVIVGMLLAASTGIVGATVVTMGMLSLPSMMKAGYDQKLQQEPFVQLAHWVKSFLLRLCLFYWQQSYKELMKKQLC
jgi:TRAP-type mannitol/chloroaromatic compound transport system permease large subunit